MSSTRKQFAVRQRGEGVDAWKPLDELGRGEFDDLIRGITRYEELRAEGATVSFWDFGSEDAPGPGMLLSTEPTKVRDAFVRAINRDGTVQLGFADPELEYGNRPIEVITISRATGFQLISSLASNLAPDAADTAAARLGRAA